MTPSTMSTTTVLGTFAQWAGEQWNRLSNPAAEAFSEGAAKAMSDTASSTRLDISSLSLAEKTELPPNIVNGLRDALRGTDYVQGGRVTNEGAAYLTGLIVGSHWAQGSNLSNTEIDAMRKAIEENAEEIAGGESVNEAASEQAAKRSGINMAKIYGLPDEAIDAIRTAIRNAGLRAQEGGGLSELGEQFSSGAYQGWLHGKNIQLEEPDIADLRRLIKENEHRIAPAPDASDEAGSEDPVKRLITAPSPESVSIGAAATAFGIGLLMFMANPTGALSGFALQVNKGDEA